MGSDILDHHVPSSFSPEETGFMVKCCHVGERVQSEFVSGLSELYDIQLLMLHILSSWLLQNSAACPVNNDFEYQINIFLILFFINVIFPSYHGKDKLDAEYADILQSKTGITERLPNRKGWKVWKCSV